MSEYVVYLGGEGKGCLTHLEQEVGLQGLELIVVKDGIDLREKISNVFDWIRLIVADESLREQAHEIKGIPRVIVSTNKECTAAVPYDAERPVQFQYTIRKILTLAPRAGLEIFPIEPSGILFIVMGPTAAGKSTLIDLITQDPNCERVVRYTDRAKRSYEIDGKDYIFLSSDEFDNMIFGRRFLCFHEGMDGKSRYGIPATLRKRLEAGSSCFCQMKKMHDREQFNLAKTNIIPIIVTADLKDLRNSFLDRGDDPQDQKTLERLLQIPSEERYYRNMISANYCINTSKWTQRQAVQILRNIIADVHDSEYGSSFTFACRLMQKLWIWERDISDKYVTFSCPPNMTEDQKKKEFKVYEWPIMATYSGKTSKGIFIGMPPRRYRRDVFEERILTELEKSLNPFRAVCKSKGTYDYTSIFLGVTTNRKIKDGLLYVVSDGGPKDQGQFAICFMEMEEEEYDRLRKIWNGATFPHDFIKGARTHELLRPEMHLEMVGIQTQTLFNGLLKDDHLLA